MFIEGYQIIEKVYETVYTVIYRAIRMFDRLPVMIKLLITDVFSSSNTIANQFFTAGWASATIPVSFIAGYNAIIISAPILPLVSCYWLPLV